MMARIYLAISDLFVYLTIAFNNVAAASMMTARWFQAKAKDMMFDDLGVKP